MTKSNLPVPANEQDRLKTLFNYQILDTFSEEEFDNITKLIAYICARPETKSWDTLQWEFPFLPVQSLLDELHTPHEWRRYSLDRKLLRKYLNQEDILSIAGELTYVMHCTDCGSGCWPCGGSCAGGWEVEAAGHLEWAGRKRQLAADLLPLPGGGQVRQPDDWPFLLPWGN